MNTDDVAVFVQAAAGGSLSEAARRLGLTPAAASRRLLSLERRLKVRLMHRSTRSASLTAEGEAFLPHARVMIEADEGGRASLSPLGRGASGMLRMTAPANFGRRLVVPILPALLQANSELRVDLVLTDAVLDLPGGGYDLAVRVGRLADSALIGQRLAANRILLCASPGYRDRFGLPKSVTDLAHHDCLVFAGQVSWTFILNGRSRQVRVATRFSSNSIDAIREACLSGGGLALLSESDVRTELSAGTLLQVELPDGAPPPLDVWTVYPTSRQLPRKVRVFVEALRTQLATPD